MKAQIINHHSGDIEIETNSGIRVFDGSGNAFIITLNKLGELEVNGVDGSLCVIPQYANEIIVRQKV